MYPTNFRCLTNVHEPIKQYQAITAHLSSPCPLSTFSSTTLCGQYEMVRWVAYLAGHKPTTICNQGCGDKGRYCKQMCEYVDPVRVSISTLSFCSQASLNDVCRILRNASLGDFVVVRTSYSVLTQTQTVQYSLLHTHSIRYSLLLLGYKPVQHVTVLNIILYSASLLHVSAKCCGLNV